MATKKTAAIKPTAKKALVNINLSGELTDETIAAIKREDGTLSVEKFIARLADTDAAIDSDMELSVIHVTMKDGTEHTMLKNADTLSELESDDDIDGVVKYIADHDLPLLLRLVANSVSPDFADDPDERIFKL